MFSLATLCIAALAWQSQAAPIQSDLLRRAGEETFVPPPPGRDGPGPTFDATATRAATAAQIRSAASPNICLDVSNFRAGDFRFNLVPVALKACDSNVAGQKFDLITKGAHNNVPDGSRTLIVSSQQFTCVDRRSNINDRSRPGLFACGGRAAGDGETTADQQYFFNRTASLSGGIGFPIVNNAVNNGVGPGNQCLSLNADGFLINTPCAPPFFTPQQTWIVGAGGAAAPPPPPPPVKTTPPVTAVPSVTATNAAPTPPAAGTPEKFVLPVPADGPGPTFDATATRAATGAQIKSAASPNLCFDVSDFRAGDFRFNLVPLALRKCDRSVDGQKFDLITKGQHNNVKDASRTLIVSSQQFTCIDRRGNKNDRNRPGLFACGGRAAGDGETTADQQFFFNPTANLAGGIGFPVTNTAVNNGVGPGNTCLTLSVDGFVSNTPCSPPFFTPEQTWIVSGGSASAPPPAPVSKPPPAVSTPPTPANPTATAPPPASTSAAAGTPEKFVLPVPNDGPGPLFDATATRAATKAQIRSKANPDLCFDVSNFRAGDFRFNLVPLALKKCDKAIDGQKFDLITKGAHNNVADGSRTLIVSSQQFTCIDRRGNKNNRNRPGLFACGGRAAGDGETTADQQFFFNPSASLSGGIGFPVVNTSVNKGVGAGNTCLTLNADGFVSNAPCAPPFFTPEQTWIVG
ncbi:hypothetical protein H0H81_007292 [Sphagnurus paluster]|uniref:Uncharacterized protein n=1 Tax=Sphagnurus paluster TaxID=117069 RepID=A0A9P7GQV1_9AGAR|nr:hypothetical protein H0H81_007292 [Sphagnurus paluster]